MVNMTGKYKAKSQTAASDSSNVEYSPGLKGLFLEPEGIYQHTRTQTGVAIPLDYKCLVTIADSDNEDKHSAVGTS
jgi:hypothetical protein